MMDSNCPGLVLRVTETGSRSFSVLYRVAGKTGRTGTGRTRYGKQQRLTLGRWPDVGLKEARDRAREIVAGATEGCDPKKVQEQEKKVREETQLEDVIARFISQECKANVKSWKNVERILRLHVLPRWGDWPIADIRRKHVHALLDDLVEEGKRGTAREVRKHLSRLFNWSVDRELVNVNPIYRLQRKDLMPNPDAGRALTDEELKAIWRGAGELGYPFGDYYRLLLLTGQRRAEWAGAKRSDIDLDNGTLEIPRARYKGRRDHLVPFSTPVRQIVDRLPEWHRKDYCLFSTKSGLVPISGFTQGKRRLDEAAREVLREIVRNPNHVLPHYRVHDFRVTCETRLAQLGFSQDVRDAVLGHAKPGLQRTYNKHDYMDEKHAALEAYAQHIMEVVS